MAFELHGARQGGVKADYRLPRHVRKACPVGVLQAASAAGVP